MSYLVLKKEKKMLSCGVPGCTNQADNNSNITLVTIIMLL